MTFDFHSAARREFQDAAHWYEGRSSGLGDRFVAAVEAAVQVILVDPLRFQPAGNNIHVFRMKKFPYKLFYTFDEDAQFVRIYAVMHEKQRPDYWRSRVGERPGV